jgi:hypothetical protein
MSSQSLRHGVVAAMSILAIAVASATAAQGDTAYTGTTAEGIKVKLVVATAGNATVFRIAGTEAECEEGHLQTDPAIFKKFDVSDPGAFTDKRKSKTKDGRYLLRDSFMTTGQVGADGTSWTGTYEKTTRVLKDGRRIDTCVLSTTWEVS